MGVVGSLCVLLAAENADYIQTPDGFSTTCIDYLVYTENEGAVDHQYSL